MCIYIKTQVKSGSITNIEIDTFQIGKDNHVFIIAELSANHYGSLENALNAINAVKRTGANAIKLQTYTADIITIDCKNDDVKILHATIWGGKYLYDLCKESYSPWEWHKELFQAANEEGLICFSSPFDKTAVDLLEKLNVPAYKIASSEIADIPLLENVVSKGKPVIISTGIAGLEDIELALDACQRMGNEQVILLKCTLSYRASVEEANLAMITEHAKRFDVISSLSDHTLGITVSVVATVLGARLIEKHFRLDGTIGGPDASFSLNEEDFIAMGKAMREAELAVEKVDYSLTTKMKRAVNFHDFSM